MFSGHLGISQDTSIFSPASQDSALMVTLAILSTGIALTRETAERNTDSGSREHTEKHRLRTERQPMENLGKSSKNRRRTRETRRLLKIRGRFSLWSLPVVSQEPPHQTHVRENHTCSQLFASAPNISARKTACPDTISNHVELPQNSRLLL